MKILCLDQSPDLGKIPTDSAWHRTGNHILYSENSYARVSINFESSVIRMIAAKTISLCLSVTNSRLRKVLSTLLTQFPTYSMLNDYLEKSLKKRFLLCYSLAGNRCEYINL